MLFGSFWCCLAYFDVIVLVRIRVGFTVERILFWNDTSSHWRVSQKITCALKNECFSRPLWGRERLFAEEESTKKDQTKNALANKKGTKFGSEEDYEQYLKYKVKMLGNMKFIGELLTHGMIRPSYHLIVLISYVYCWVSKYNTHTHTRLNTRLGSNWN